MPTFLLILIASLVVSLLSFAGALFLVRKNFFSPNRIMSLISFAAGVMLASAFFDLLPEALEMENSENVLLFTFFGIVSFFLLERFVVWFHHHDNSHGVRPASVLVLFGDSIHNMIDGIAIAAAFIASPILGVTTTLAICAHEIPQEIGDFGILVESGYSKKKALFYNFLSGLTALVGAVAGFYFLDATQGILWLFLSFSAGMFIYISCADLIPALHENFSEQRKWIQTVPFIFGASILILLVHFLEG